MSDKSTVAAAAPEKSKFSAAASQLWNQNKLTVGSNKSFNISLNSDLNKDKDSKQPSTDLTTKPATTHVFGSGMFAKFGENKEDGPKNASQIFQAFAAKKSEGFTSSNNASTSADWLSTENSSSQKEVAEPEKVEKPKTGEEDERNIFQSQCKFYQYDVESKSWKERGLGTLRLNETKDDDWDADVKARLVARNAGTQKVLLNSLLFPEMFFESVSEKRIKISAHTPDSELPQLFLIQSTPAKIAELVKLLRQRIKEETPQTTVTVPKKRKNDDEDTADINEKTQKLNTNTESGEEDEGEEGSNSSNDSNEDSSAASQ